MRYLPAIALLLAGCATTQIEDSIVKTTYEHRYGVEVPEEEWTKAGEMGVVETVDADGVTCRKHYNHGVLEGETSYTYPFSEVIHRTEYYSQGKKIEELLYYQSGEPYQKIKPISSDEIEVMTWYLNGAPRALELFKENVLVNGDYYNDQYQLEDQIIAGSGSRKLRDRWGQMVCEQELVSGAIVKETYYHQNGFPKEIIPYKNGWINGEKLFYTPSGEPVAIEQWEEGVQHGLTLLFSNGEIWAQVPYHKGVKEGIERHLSSSGDIVEEITWMHGVKHGPYNKFIDGATQNQWYFQDRLVSKSAYEKMIRVH